MGLFEWIIYGLAHVGIGGEVHYGVDSLEGWLHACHITQVAANEFEALCEELKACGKVVEDYDFMAMLAQYMSRMTANISCAANDKNFHGLFRERILDELRLELTYFRCSSLTGAFTGCPSRMTVTSTTSPTLLRRSASVKSYRFLIGLSPNCTRMSPALNPAFAAGDPGFTSENFTPFSVWPKSGIEPKYGPYPPPPLAASGLSSTTVTKVGRSDAVASSIAVLPTTST